jgi:hypothetical protein
MRTAHLSNTAKRMEPSMLTTVCFSSSSTNYKQTQQQKQQQQQKQHHQQHTQQHTLRVPQVGCCCLIVQLLHVCNACACRNQGHRAAQLRNAAYHARACPHISVAQPSKSIVTCIASNDSAAAARRHCDSTDATSPAALRWRCLLHPWA